MKFSIKIRKAVKEEASGKDRGSENDLSVSVAQQSFDACFTGISFSDSLDRQSCWLSNFDPTISYTAEYEVKQGRGGTYAITCHPEDVAEATPMRFLLATDPENGVCKITRLFPSDGDIILEYKITRNGDNYTFNKAYVSAAELECMSEPLRRAYQKETYDAMKVGLFIQELERLALEAAAEDTLSDEVEV